MEVVPRTEGLKQLGLGEFEGLGFRNLPRTGLQGSWQGTCSKRNFWLKSVGEYLLTS